ncbi:ubiquitin C-terminal hydrolase 12-like [Vicia villosa]|uniref:ubiquitin C-terminal hydrolase 12-like n=1 Tax=Vicia villosa TaxID=3911 RepID=UPI00273A86D3|nr:ubiquitin C-terminal hydrolase 12-like [Vicia villosa]
MEDEESYIKIFETFTWKITEFTLLKNVAKVYSEAFVLGGYPWMIILYPSRNFLNIFFKAVQMKADHISEDWYRDVKFKLTLVNQLDPNKTITREYKNKFSASYRSRRYSFMPIDELYDPEKGFVLNDECIVEVELFVRESKLENQVNQAASLARHTNVEVLTNDLEVSWEEFKKYRTDLTWLEPHVQSALEIKNYVDKALRLEKWKENEAAVEFETEKLKTKLIGKS